MEPVTTAPTKKPIALEGCGNGIRYANMWKILKAAKVRKCSKAVPGFGCVQTYKNPI